MKRILVAEDEQAIREFIVINLESGGYEVQQAENGVQALRMFDDCNGDFDIALLDIMMPEMDGLELCKRLRERSKQLGIIMLSARTQEMDKVTGLLVGADDYITKPFPLGTDGACQLCLPPGGYEPRNGTYRQRDPFGGFCAEPPQSYTDQNGVPIELTQVEFQIMECFLRIPTLHSAVQKSSIRCGGTRTLARKNCRCQYTTPPR